MVEGCAMTDNRSFAFGPGFTSQKLIVHTPLRMVLAINNLDTNFLYIANREMSSPADAQLVVQLGSTFEMLYRDLFDYMGGEFWGFSGAGTGNVVVTEIFRLP